MTTISKYIVYVAQNIWFDIFLLPGWTQVTLSYLLIIIIILQNDWNILIYFHIRLLLQTSSYTYPWEKNLYLGQDVNYGPGRNFSLKYINLNPSGGYLSFKNFDYLPILLIQYVTATSTLLSLGGTRRTEWEISGCEQ